MEGRGDVLTSANVRVCACMEKEDPNRGGGRIAPPSPQNDSNNFTLQLISVAALVRDHICEDLLFRPVSFSTSVVTKLGAS